MKHPVKSDDCIRIRNSRDTIISITSKTRYSKTSREPISFEIPYKLTNFDKSAPLILQLL